MANKARTSRRGVTLIELVVVIAVVGILAAMSSGYINQVVGTWQTVSFRMDTVAQMRSALDRMSREIRQVKNATSVYAADSSVFRFVGVDDATITYNISGTNVLRSNAVLATGAARLNFAYYDAEGEALAHPDVFPDATDIRRIAVTLEMRSAAQNKTMTVQVFPRNLGE
ncbi:MAG: type II secretion system protein [Candidatus Omnitrophota bacterium]